MRLAADPTSIREVDYTVTVPGGSLLGQTQLTVGIGFLEHVTYVFSPTQPWGTLRLAVSVVSATGVAPFPVSLRAVTLLNAGTASGLSSDTISVTLHPLLML